MGFCPSPAIMQSSCPGAMAVCGRLAPPQSPPAAKSLRTGARARSRAPAMAAGGGADEWMFVDAKGLQKGARALREIEIGVLARPFGAQVVLGDERWIEVSSAADELLLASACQQRRRVAYTVGRASTSGTFANAQGFLAGTTASLLSVRDVQRSAGGGAARVLVRGEGRVVLQSVKTMKPSIMATAFLLRDDAPETASRRDYIEKLKTRIVDEAAKIQALRESTAANSLQSKLNSLKKTSFLVDIPDEQYQDLIKRSAAAAAAASEGASQGVRETPAAGGAGQQDATPILQRCEQVTRSVRGSGRSPRERVAALRARRLKTRVYGKLRSFPSSRCARRMQKMRCWCGPYRPLRCGRGW
eukprot:Tamp_13262.p1 GENE.Tamp_13262~~Tamp_13262.p1  ORF type:complete len:402 (+),score=64.74 Tamp_13262:130-1206(+)